MAKATAGTDGSGSGGSGTADADVIVVGAGPGGSSAAYHLASTGLDVLLLEKTAFPREKVCGDGLTPRAVRSLIEMGIDTSESAGWARNRGLRIVGGNVRLELPWPELANWPGYGLVRPRLDFDELLARHAEKAGARLSQSTSVTAPVVDERSGRVVGVRARTGPDREPVTYRAPLVVAADGNSARIALAMGIRRREDRPLGVAVRRYYRSTRTHDDHLESHLELWEGRPRESRLLPGYGWIFGVGDGTSNVGLGLLNTTSAFQNTNYQDLLRRWLAALPPEWGFVEENATGPVRGSALPMGFSRTPHYRDGVLLVGDSGGMINPFNGEGIAYALESGRYAAEVAVQALARAQGPARERALSHYPELMRARYGGYYTLGRYFVQLIGNPTVMALGAKYGLPRPVLMRFLLKIMANLTDPRGGDAMDRLINAMTRLAPAA
ncbi:geranylgeranyl reductase family protein [Candidatus Frankia nodulisporulans]|uniref:geranylgeranyl reductase family protein n=1 Tax=Candidatus Frankia nodulisporulans TaxID=2060052 RepID=UPI0013D84C37|nr:geranylgeranyl reductase family protein [Candidatus Frankia nodulisporulans]